MRRNFPISAITQRVGIAIRDLRVSRNMSATDLAEQIGVTQSYVSRAERGDSRIDLEFLSRIAGVFGVPLHTLVSQVESKSQAPKTVPLTSAVGKAMSDPTFAGLVGCLAIAHRNRANNWLYSACLKLSQ